MIKKINTMMAINPHEDIFEVKLKVNEIIDVLNNFEAVMIAIMERAERVSPERHAPAEPLEKPLTSFGFRPEIYCTCGKNVTPCCPIHTNVTQI